MVIETNKFAKVTDSSFEEHGVAKGDIVFIAGDAMHPVSEDDPYTFRKIFIAAFTNEEGKVMAEEKGFFISGNRLELVCAELEEELQNKLKADYGGDT